MTLLVPAARLAGPGRREMERLAAELDAAVAAMAPRVPLPGGDARAGAAPPAPPIVVAVEDDFVAQARQTGRIGEAVPAGTPGDRAELHLVYHPDDLFAYRVGLAERLIARVGLIGAGVPPPAGPAPRAVGAVNNQGKKGFQTGFYRVESLKKIIAKREIPSIGFDIIMQTLLPTEFSKEFKYSHPLKNTFKAYFRWGKGRAVCLRFVKSKRIYLTGYWNIRQLPFYVAYCYGFVWGLVCPIKENETWTPILK